MLTINTNLSSLIAQSSMKQSTDKLNQAIERMTTGFKINHASDNAANYSIARKLDTQISSLEIAESNIMMGSDLLETAESNSELINQHVSRIRDLVEQASNGTYGDESIKAIQSEINSRIEEINRIKNTSEYNGLSLFGDYSATVLGSNGLFVNSVQITTDNVPDGYTAVTNADELRTALENNENIVLLNDIDMSSINNWSNISPAYYSATLDGNGYTIQNLDCSGDASNNAGLFETAGNGTVIKNLKMTNVTDYSYYGSPGVLFTVAESGASIIIDNCSIHIAMTASNYNYGGGVVSTINSGAKLTISNSQIDYRSNNVTHSGGLVGTNNGTLNVENCAVTANELYGDPYNTFVSGGIVAINSGNLTIKDTLVNAPTHYSAGGFIGENNGTYSFINSVLSSGERAIVGDGAEYTSTATSAELVQMIQNKIVGRFIQENIDNRIINLQVGINSDANSRITVDTTLFMKNLSALNSMDVSDSNSLNLLDDILAELSAYQTKLGATQNRLESALESVMITSDNLISSRSTIRDADIAEVSSHYIQQQILQQASATLLATANQSPSIALQLI